MTRQFFAFAAACSIISAFTTLVLIFGPDFYPAPRSFEDRIALLAQPAFQLRMWVSFFHPFLAPRWEPIS